MADPDILLSTPLASFRSQFDTWWMKLAPRERRLVAAGVAALGLMIVWMIAIGPAWRTLRDAPRQMDALDAQMQQMQRLAGESRELRAAPTVSPSQAGAALRAASDRLGPKAGLSLQGERATLNLTGIQGPQLAAWLGEARSAARARVVEAQLSRGPEGYSGSIVMTVGAAP